MSQRVACPSPQRRSGVSSGQRQPGVVMMDQQLGRELRKAGGGKRDCRPAALLEVPNASETSPDFLLWRGCSACRGQAPARGRWLPQASVGRAALEHLMRAERLPGSRRRLPGLGLPQPSQRRAVLFLLSAVQSGGLPRLPRRLPEVAETAHGVVFVCSSNHLDLAQGTRRARTERTQRLRTAPAPSEKSGGRTSFSVPSRLV